MDPCWKFVWNVDPAALIVPLAAGADEDEPPPGELPDEDAPVPGEELDEEHAARDKAAATTAPPTVMTCWLRRRCISGFSPYGFTHFPAATISRERPVSLETMVCQYSLPALTVSPGKQGVYMRRPEG
jgi:hypothetical protein